MSDPYAPMPTSEPPSDPSGAPSQGSTAAPRYDGSAGYGADSSYDGSQGYQQVHPQHDGTEGYQAASPYDPFPGYQSAPQHGGQQGYSAAPQAAAPARTPEPLRSKITNNAIALIVVGLLCGGMIPSILGIVALTQVDSNPSSAQTLNKWGWIVCAILAVILLGTLLVSFVFPLVMLLMVGAGASTY